MRKLLLTAAFAATTALGATTSYAQDTSAETSATFTEGTKNLGISLGFGRSHGYYGNYVSLPAIAVTYDQGWMDNVGPGTIGLGGIVGFKTAHYDYPGIVGPYKATWTSFIIAARGTYHLHLNTPKFDPYAGIMLGFRINSYTDTYYDKFGANPNSYGNLDAVAGLFIGAKYNFAQNAGVFLELGYDISFARLGVSFTL